MELDRIRTTIEQAVCVSVQSIQLPGIVDAAVRSVAVTPQHVQRVAAELARHGQSDIEFSTEVELFLRVSSDVLSSIQCVPFRVCVTGDRSDFRAIVKDETNWGTAWEKGIEPIRKFALQSMKEDVWKMDATLAEDSYTTPSTAKRIAKQASVVRKTRASRVIRNFSPSR